MDERYAAVDVVGKGLVLFSAYDTRICCPCLVLTSTFVKLFTCGDRECRQGRCLHVQTSGIHGERALFAISIPRYTEPAQIIGDLHLAGPELIERIPPTINFLSRSLTPSPTYILPMHCSGFAVKCALQEEFGGGCVPAGVGMKIDLATTPEEKALDTRLIGSFLDNLV